MGFAGHQHNLILTEHRRQQDKLHRSRWLHEAAVGGGRRERVEIRRERCGDDESPETIFLSLLVGLLFAHTLSAVINWLISNKISSTATRAHMKHFGCKSSSLPQQQHHRVYQHTYQLCGLNSRLKCSELCEAKQPLWPAMCGLIIKATGKGFQRIAFQMQITRKVGFRPGRRTS